MKLETDLGKVQIEFDTKLIESWDSNGNNGFLFIFLEQNDMLQYNNPYVFLFEGNVSREEAIKLVLNSFNLNTLFFMAPIISRIRHKKIKVKNNLN